MAKRGGIVYGYRGRRDAQKGVCGVLVQCCLCFALGVARLLSALDATKTASLNAERDAARDREVHAGDVVRLRSGKKSNRVGDIFGETRVP